MESKASRRGVEAITPGATGADAGRPTPYAATTPGPCVFPRCVKGEQPSYCGHDCDVREKPYEHEYGTPADGLAAKRQDSALERLANLIIEHGLIIYHGDPDPFAAQKREAGAWQVPTRIYVGIPQFKQPTTANDLPLDADEGRDRG